ncbi:hypothetical protein EUGRSUZ_C00610 [Eucalyptus grandis]|uniref:Uncharacterized protein n=2 Tax=Eucalyptus grandis TaxID=71139 RepID=A0ACC3LB00_EUCGR|nr:hypothetical protein EUGRSUZ_C00610 [Eucalyptus grandis]
MSLPCATCKLITFNLVIRNKYCWSCLPDISCYPSTFLGADLMIVKGHNMNYKIVILLLGILQYPLLI